MANFDYTLSDERKFPNGSSVSLYLRSNWPTPDAARNPTGSPVGSRTGSAQTVSGGSATFAATPEGNYWAYASVNGNDVYERVTVSGSITGPYIPTTALDTDGGLAANNDSRVPSEKAVRSYADAGANLVAPYHPALYANTNTHPANRVRLARVIIPRTGNLRDVAIFVTAQSGNVIAGVYDTGDASAGNRSKLWDSGSVAVGAANAWQIVGDPNLAVTKGQQVELAFMGDSANVFGTARANSQNNAQGNLPTGFYAAAGGASPKIGSDFSAGSFAMPPTLAEASISVNFVHAIIARIS